MFMNQFYGTPSGGVAAVVTFMNSSGNSYIVNLISGQTIRDYNNDGWVNVLSGSSTGVTAQQWWGTQDSNSNNNSEDSQRLDAQTIALPASWNGTDLVSVQIDHTNYTGGDDVLSALQVNNMTPSVPEPGAILLLGLGLLGLTLFKVEFRKA